jgi:hypothetical protein
MYFSLENQPYYNLESVFRAFKRKEMKALRRLAENDAATTSCITYKPSPCDLENPSNDAKGEDE